MEYRSVRIGQIGNNDTIRFAVKELVSYLKKMDSSLAIDVLKTDKRNNKFKKIIWVGLDPSFGMKLEHNDTIQIEIKERNGYITGSNERSVLIAVYRFLKEMGCYWVRPGIEGERIPHRMVENIDVHIFERASYLYRGVCIEGANSYENILDMIDYLPKVGLNSYFIQHMKSLPAGYFSTWYQHRNQPYLAKEDIGEDEYLAMFEHLEAEIKQRNLIYHKTGHGWTSVPLGLDGKAYDDTTETMLSESTRSFFAMRDGERKLWKNHPLKTNLCYSNPNVRSVMIDSIIRYCKEQSNIDVLHVWLADDNNNQCECENCITKRPADWYVIFLNELDQRLTEENLDTKIAFAVYQDLLWAPLTEQIKNSERFELMFAPYDRWLGEYFCNSLEYAETLPPYVRNKLTMPFSVAETIEHLRQWQHTYKGEGFMFDYYMMWAHLNDLGYEKCARQIHADMKALEDLHMNGMISCQVQRSFFPTALPFYVMAASLWNKECNLEQIMMEYYVAAFGEDGQQVHQYMETISSLLVLYDGPFYVDASRIYGPFCKDYNALKKTVQDFCSTIERHLDMEENTQVEWQLLQLYQKYISYISRSMELLEEHKDEDAKENLDQFLDFLQKQELKMQKVLDVFNAYGHWERSLNPYHFK